MNDERWAHESWQAVRDVHLEGLLLINDLILGNRRLELDEDNDGGSVVEVVNENGRTLDGAVPVDNILNLTQLDTLTTELDLAIRSAAIDNVTIGTVHCNVTSPVETFSRDEGAGDERLLGLLKLVKVSTSQLNATNEQLSLDTDGGRAHIPVEDVQSVVVERATNDTGEGNVRNMGVNTVDGSFGGTVHVHELGSLTPILD